MGCNTSKAASNAAMRSLEYEQEARSENQGLKVIPSQLDNEEWRDGLISARTLFNSFHAGFCSAYIQNSKYLLLLDFRNVEDWIVERVATSEHHERLTFSDRGLQDYSLIVLYDEDGTSVGNIRSPLRKAFVRMKASGLDPRILLGGVQSLQTAPYLLLLERPSSIPFAVALQPTVQNSLESLDTAAASEISEDSFTPDLELVNPRLVEPVRKSIIWLPTMILEKSLYLGTSDQAGDQRVISSLGITHVLSTSRVRTEKFRGLVYILVNKSSFSHSTLKLTTNFILDAITSGGSVLVHGCDGLDQSAAVVLAALMRHHSATIEDCLWFLTSARPGLSLSGQTVEVLVGLEEETFGRQITDIDSLWCIDE